MASIFDESKIFSRDLSIWDGFLLDMGDQNYETDPLDFFTAASLGESEIVLSCLERKMVKPNAKNRSGWSAIMYASYMGHDSTVDTLVKYGADPNIKTPQGYSPLILAAMCGNDPVIKLLAKQHQVEIDAIDNIGWTALFHAASAGHQQATDLLLQYGADVEIKEPSQGLTPLMEAAASGHEMVVQHLLKKGACVTTKDKTGDDAMSLAMEYGHVKIAGIVEQNKQAVAASYKPDNAGGSKKAVTSSSGAGGPSAVNKCNLSGGPSIHAGPKAFAQMTGLGSDGKPHPHNAIPVFLQENQQPKVDYLQTQAKWSGPKNLETLLKSIDCGKYSNAFQQQGVDLHVFLTLTEADLKEIGIGLFGPRRKMVSAIARSVSEIQGVVINDQNELSYADALNAKLLRLQDRLKEMEMENSNFKSMFAQERQLRKVTESVLVEHKEMVSQLRCTTDKLQARHVHFNRILDDFRTQAFSKHFEKMHLTNQNYQRFMSPKDKLISIPSAAVHDLEALSQNTGECLCEMRAILEKASSVVPVGSVTTGSKADVTSPIAPPVMKRRDVS